MEKKLILICKIFLSKKKELSEEEKAELRIKRIINSDLDEEAELDTNFEETCYEGLILFSVKDLLDAIILEDRIQIGLSDYTYSIQGGKKEFYEIVDAISKLLINDSNMNIINIIKD